MTRRIEAYVYLSTQSCPFFGCFFSRGFFSLATFCFCALFFISFYFRLPCFLAVSIVFWLTLALFCFQVVLMTHTPLVYKNEGRVLIRPCAAFFLCVSLCFFPFANHRRTSNTASMTWMLRGTAIASYCATPSGRRNSGCVMIPPNSGSFQLRRIPILDLCVVVLLLS